MMCCPWRWPVNLRASRPDCKSHKWTSCNVPQSQQPVLQKHVQFNARRRSTVQPSASRKKAVEVQAEAEWGVPQ